MFTKSHFSGFQSWKYQPRLHGSNFNISLSLAGNPNLMMKYRNSHQIQIHGPIIVEGLVLPWVQWSEGWVVL